MYGAAGVRNKGCTPATVLHPTGGPGGNGGAGGDARQGVVNPLWLGNADPDE